MKNYTVAIIDSGRYFQAPLALQAMSKGEAEQWAKDNAGRYLAPLHVILIEQVGQLARAARHTKTI